MKIIDILNDYANGEVTVKDLLIVQKYILEKDNNG